MPPSSTPVPVSAPGCPSSAAEARSAPVDRRTKRRPRGLRAPFAPRAGRLPGDGPATVGGVDLPAGSRCGSHWTLDAATPRAVSLARHLASAFPQTGLWPVLWNYDDDPDASLQPGSDPAEADGLDVHGVLQKIWNGALPPLAARSTGAPPPDPFGLLGRVLATNPSQGDAYVLMLVPVNRPADAAGVLGSIMSGEITDAQATAVLRSWEDRFGAVLTEVGPGDVGLAVGSPPTGKAQALALATEQMGFAPDSSKPEELPIVAQALLSGPLRERPATRDFWSLGWAD